MFFAPKDACFRGHKKAAGAALKLKQQPLARAHTARQLEGSEQACTWKAKPLPVGQYQDEMVEVMPSGEPSPSAGPSGFVYFVQRAPQVQRETRCNTISLGVEPRSRANLGASPNSCSRQQRSPSRRSDGESATTPRKHSAEPSSALTDMRPGCGALRTRRSTAALTSAHRHPAESQVKLRSSSTRFE